ncbi:hypothetical protein IFM89_015801 [Coptis chinensis]|uniref:RNase H type-1 domain-containing protein n=1 Tax=Coptis chinensis TaxID=261450 RepID=A0A835MBJ7_9MAGN|nr:hypothetical protein IFM89_015801 [Coptis chinensis]
MYLEEMTETDTVKLNGDGSLTDYRSGNGGTIRDANGEVVLAYSEAGGLSSVLFQELKALLNGLQGCLMLKIMKVEVASDSLYDLSEF